MFSSSTGPNPRPKGTVGGPNADDPESFVSSFSLGVFSRVGASSRRLRPPARGDLRAFFFRASRRLNAASSSSARVHSTPPLLCGLGKASRSTSAETRASVESVPSSPSSRRDQSTRPGETGSAGEEPVSPVSAFGISPASPVPSPVASPASPPVMFLISGAIASAMSPANASGTPKSASKGKPENGNAPSLNFLNVSATSPAGAASETRSAALAAAVRTPPAAVSPARANDRASVEKESSSFVSSVLESSDEGVSDPDEGATEGAARSEAAFASFVSSFVSPFESRAGHPSRASAAANGSSFVSSASFSSRNPLSFSREVKEKEKGVVSEDESRDGEEEDSETEEICSVSASAAAAALRMAASCVASSSSDVAHQSSALVSMLLRALDVRRSHPASFDGGAIDRVESAAAEAFVTAASSQTESAFAPTLATATEWAKARASDPEAARARLSALFCVASALADQLRGVFTPLATPILDLAAAALDPAADIAVASAKRRRKEKRENRDETNTDSSSRDAFRAECDAWRVRARALGAVRRICAHDSGEIIDAARFNQLHPLVTACLTAKPPSVGGKSRDVSSFPTPSDLDDLHDDAALAPGGVGAEAAACVAALIAAAPDDTLWKPAHRGTLQATRDASPRARRVAVAALAATTARLEEEFLTLLPESIPYLSELFEDPDEGVEGAARELTATLAELSGEDLKSLMATGGSERV
mmetsp:Transcript_7578/g.31531  ORF Transcript_7578/g.31531 Transcript_7578/m.31531 type:complete len:712 (-) Transcript_7578:281-2416(-)